MVKWPITGGFAKTSSASALEGRLPMGGFLTSKAACFGLEERNRECAGHMASILPFGWPPHRPRVDLGGSARSCILAAARAGGFYIEVLDRATADSTEMH